MHQVKQLHRRFAVADSELLLAARLSGEGAPVVLLHGLQSCRDMFLPWHGHASFSGYSLLAIDLPGFGESQQQRDFSCTLSHFVDAILAVADYRGWSRFHVVGHSLGGMLGTMMLEHHANRMLSLVSMEGNMQREDCSESRHAAERDDDSFESYFSELRARVRNEDSPSSELRTKALSVVQPNVFRDVSRDIVRTAESGELYQQFINARVPKLLIVGEDSSYVSRPHSAFASTVVVPNAKHFMMLDQPELVLKAVSKFLQSVRA